MSNDVSVTAINLADLATAIIESIPRALAGGVIVGGLAATAVYVWPKTYTSTSYISISEFVAMRDKSAAESTSRDLEALIHSPIILDRIAKEYPDILDRAWVLRLSNSQEAKRRVLNGHLRLKVANGGDRKTSELYSFEADSYSPTSAQALNGTVIKSLLDGTKLGPEKRRLVELRLERAENQLKSVSALIDRLERESSTLVVQGIFGELASPLANLFGQRTALITLVENLKMALDGVSSDVVKLPPSLPDEASSPKVLLFVCSAMAGATFLFLLTGLARKGRRQSAT